MSVEDFTSREKSDLSVNFFNKGDIHLFNFDILYRPASDKTLSDVYGTLGVSLVNATTGEVKLMKRKEDGAVDKYDFTVFKPLADHLRSHGNPTPFLIFGSGKGYINLK